MYEVSRICTSRILKGRHELYVKWKDYNQSHNSWVLLQILLKDVPALLAAYEAKPATFTPRASAPIRATKTKVAQKSVGPARCVSHTLEECVGYHTLISNLVCGILYHTLFHSNSGECVGHSKFECVGQSSDKT